MVWTSLHAAIHRTIRARNLLQPRQGLLIAVSGGQDSLCLLKLLLDLQSKWEWRLGVAHCNHCWRQDSTANAQHVEELVNSYSVPFYLETADKPVNTEAAARDWRYQVLTQVALQHNYVCVITGHTASDRAETLLYNLMRGTGADGLQALTWRRQLADNVQLVRPLLEVTRKETGQFCQDFDLKIWEDSTNDDLKYARNRIRKELLPYLHQNFNPQVTSNLAQTAELLQADVEYLEQAAQELREQAMESQYPIKLNRRILQKAPLALQRRVMRQILLEILPQSPNFEHIEKLIGLITAPRRSQTDPFPGGIIAFVEDDWICFG
ncbi:tRNA(Ile)-lysidine synthase [Dulcicalothrix desertica PCC 7102]|uniref:tRNA(Ile)-lysidine synthase n=1 Tax=Dulcicalothrix desertica PCC 7102 TaxID=232991 RepID=A0A433V4S6_9CYAN|nr:tRNA lysidine(34) synthetase TilS [Dulcicalothrix desertica]RUT01096.1 tRNA(Ile)-lysidine synthase [Dulcicalothrix desertica PCC 7102]TWH39128.1 tRNA(Ile)-lysidine synthase [Dulcicalothrix desertica PCC 7102]